MQPQPEQLRLEIRFEGDISAIDPIVKSIGKVLPLIEIKTVRSSRKNNFLSVLRRFFHRGWVVMGDLFRFDSDVSRLRDANSLNLRSHAEWFSRGRVF